VMRGGSWNNNPNRLRSANRNRNTPDNRNNNLGFRLAHYPRHGPEPRGSRIARARRRESMSPLPGLAGRG
jgi:hypothetical protein